MVAHRTAGLEPIKIWLKDECSQREKDRREKKQEKDKDREEKEIDSFNPLVSHQTACLERIWLKDVRSERDRELERKKERER